MSDTPNSTFADRAKARSVTKQVTPAETDDKAVTVGDDDPPVDAKAPATKARVPKA